MTEPHYAGGTLYHAPSRSVLLHHGDAQALVHPNAWAFFGGDSEFANGGDPITTWLRELAEELGVYLRPEQVVPLWNYRDTGTGVRRYVFYAPWPSRETEFHLGEGDGHAWFTIDDALRRLDLTPNTRADLLRLRAHLRD